MTNPIETLQALQEKARRFAEDWHEGVPKDDYEYRIREATGEAA